MQRSVRKRQLSKSAADAADGAEIRPSRRRKATVQPSEEPQTLPNSNNPPEIASSPANEAEEAPPAENGICKDLDLGALLGDSSSNGHRVASNPEVVASMFPDAPRDASTSNSNGTHNGTNGTAQTQPPAGRRIEPEGGQQSQAPTRLSSSGAGDGMRRTASRDDTFSRLASATGIDQHRRISTSMPMDIQRVSSIAEAPSSGPGRSPPPIGRTGSTGSLSEMMGIAGHALRTSGEYPSMALLSTTGSFLQRTASSIVGLAEDARRTTSDPRVRLEKLLGKLNFEFTPVEEEVIVRAFQCDSCHDVTTTCHQIRAVYDAFHLSWVGTHPEFQVSCESSQGVMVSFGWIDAARARKLLRSATSLLARLSAPRAGLMRLYALVCVRRRVKEY